MRRSFILVALSILVLVFAVWSAQKVQPKQENSEKASLSIETGIVYRSGDVTPIARTGFYLTQKSFADIIQEVNAKANETTANPLMGFVLELSMGSSGGLTSKGQASLVACQTALKQNAISSITTDFQGKGKFTALTPGTYYLVGYSLLRKGAAVWDIKVELKAGENSFVLDQNNITEKWDL